MAQSDLCPCGSGRAFVVCCGPYLTGTALPETAQALMRSRYTAYTRRDGAYLSATWHPTTRRSDLGLDEPVKWVGLDILATEAGGPEDTRGKVEFVARYKVGGRAERIHETSRFQRWKGRWFYVDGDIAEANAGSAGDPA
jgi:SEC-C motif-containing protein